MVSPRQSGFFVNVFLSVAMYCLLNQSEGKRVKETDDQPDIKHLGVRGGGQLLHLARQDRGHHQ